MPPKKQNARKDAPPPIPSRDHFERAHFAVQASVYLQQLVPGLGVNATSSSGSSRAKGAQRIESGKACDETASTLLPTSTAATEIEPSAEAADSSTAAAAASVRDRKGRSKGKRRADATDPDSLPTAPPYARLARAIGDVKGWTVHNQVKIDPSLKRALCKKCSTVLIPGLTSRVRIRPSKPLNKIHHTCLLCSATLTLLAAPTACPEPGVDGPVRARRRDKMLRSVVFHERERRESEPEVEAAAGAGTVAGAVEGAESTAAEGTTDAVVAAETTATSTITTAQTTATAIPESRDPVVPPTVQTKRPAGAGHVLWRGNEKVHGWGVPMPPVVPADEGEAGDGQKPQKQKQQQQQQPKQPKQPKQNQQQKQSQQQQPKQQNRESKGPEQQRQQQPQQPRAPQPTSEEEAANNMDIDEEAAMNM